MKERFIIGCDIHFYAEYNVNGTWYPLQEMEQDEDGYWDIDWKEEIYGERNYFVFGKIAGVRSESYFSPKGIPDDLSMQIKDQVERYGIDGHSHSWLDIDEMEEVYTDFKNKKSDYGRSGMMDTWGFAVKRFKEIDKALKGMDNKKALLERGSDDKIIRHISNQVLKNELDLNKYRGLRSVFFFDN